MYVLRTTISVILLYGPRGRSVLDRPSVDGRRAAQSKNSTENIKFSVSRTVTGDDSNN